MVTVGLPGLKVEKELNIHGSRSIIMQNRRILCKFDKRYHFVAARAGGHKYQNESVDNTLSSSFDNGSWK